MNRLLDRFSGIRITVLTSLLLGLTSLVPNVTGSALADEGPLSLSALIEELVAGNPEVKAARQRWEMAQALVPQVQTLPDPTIQLGYQKMPMVEPFQGAMYGIGQEIPFPGKLRLKGRWRSVTPTGVQVPLAQLATLRFVSGPPMIRDKNGMLAGDVFRDMTGCDVGSYVEDLKKAVAEKVQLPAVYSIVWSGQYEFMERVKLVVPLTLVIIFVTFYFSL